MPRHAHRVSRETRLTMPSMTSVSVRHRLLAPRETILLGKQAGARCLLTGVFVVPLQAVRRHDGRAERFERERADAHAWVEGNGHPTEVAQLHGCRADPARFKNSGRGMNGDSEPGDTGPAFQATQEIVR